MKEVITNTRVSDVKEIDNIYPSYSFFYKSDKIKVRGFIMFPQEIKDKMPVIFINRGGTGEHGIVTEQSIKNYNPFVQAGFITVFSQYRGCNGGEGIDRMGGDDVFDVINIYEVISRIPFADTARIGMWGASRGGMMTFQVMVRVPWVKAAVVVCPIVDEVHMAKWRPGWKEHQIDTYGGSFQEQIKRSPIYWADQIPKIPIIFFAGAKDDRTDATKTIEMAEKISAPITVFPDDGHYIAPKTIQSSIEFFIKNLV
ncbi:MAG: prolyl oligopeptidase family serine peptidase [bacterium]|nr:prolyl oligopeptidase family serine peptidase [bacterium]